MKTKRDTPDHLCLKEHYERCFHEHGDTHKGMDWPNAEDVQLRFNVMLDVIRERDWNEVHLLDIGCGTGHLLEHMNDLPQKTGHYTGIDISDAMISRAKEKHPNAPFHCLDLLDYTPDTISSVVPQADYIVFNGVFTEKREMTHHQMDAFLTRMLERAYAVCRKGLAFNVMSAHVDWMRDDLYHLPYDRLAKIIMDVLGRHHVIRADYGLYEYTVYAYR